MAYHLQSLITILEQILNPQQTHWILDDHNKPQLESVLEKAASLQQILEKSPPPEIKSLESQIRDVAHRAEDIIESYMFDQMLSSPEGASFTFSIPDLQRVMNEVDYVMEQVVKLPTDGNKISTRESEHQVHLQTIFFVRLTPSLIERGFFENIPNVKNFGFFYDDYFSSSSAVLDLSHLHKLETLRCHSRFVQTGCCYLPTLKFPCSLIKLTLDGCAIFPTFWTTLCALPKLEVLKIRKCVFKSEGETYGVWEAAKGDEFSSLQILQLESLNLVRWRADETNFPRLRHLVIKDCSELEEIPSAFGEITTLQMIELQDCSASAADSAKQILEVQQSELQDYSLQLRIIDDALSQ